MTTIQTKKTIAPILIGLSRRVVWFLFWWPCGSLSSKVRRRRTMPRLISDGFACLRRSTAEHRRTVPSSIAERRIKRHFRDATSMRESVLRLRRCRIDRLFAASRLLPRGNVEQRTAVSMQRFAANSTLNNQSGSSGRERRKQK